MNISEQIANLQTLSTGELAAEYERLHGRRPRYRSVPWMKKRIAYQLQVAAYGGLCAPARAELDRLAGDLRLPVAAPSAAPTVAVGVGSGGGKQTPRPGTTLVREWRGQQIRVAAQSDGTFEWDGNSYGSLSAVAFAVTGARWNGKLFFGLVGRKQ